MLRPALISLVLFSLFGCGNVISGIKGASSTSPLSDLIPDDKDFKTIVVYDSDPAYEVQMKQLNGQYVILALWEAAQQPSMDQLNATELLKRPFSIGKVKNDMIKLQMNEKLDWWDGAGDFWIVFVISTPSGYVTRGYLSKEPHAINQKTTYLANKDMMPYVPLDFDIAGQLPF